MQENFKKILNLRMAKGIFRFVLFMEKSEYVPPSFPTPKRISKKRRLRDNPTSAVSKRR